MRYRETYDRRCPHCEEWNPATVQTCFWCDKNLEDAPMPPPEPISAPVVTPPPDHSHKALIWAAGLVALLFGASLTMYLCR